jgi:2-oxoglutarate ferredoxin oxidoreductase subunit alpha
MQEGFSYMAGSDVPAVIVDVMRGGPGLGNIQPSQSDYNQITKSAGHGDFHPIALAPASVQEAIDLTILAFDLAEKYRTLAFVVADGSIGQMMEPAELPPMRELKKERPAWALTGAKGRERNVISSLFMGAEELEKLNQELQTKLAYIQANNEVRYEEYLVDDADLIVVAFGTAARVAQTAIQHLRREGLKVGLFRPITLWPFPSQRLLQLTYLADRMMVLEMNAGQMVHDVRLAVHERIPVHFYGRMGGIIPMPDEVAHKIHELLHLTNHRDTLPEHQFPVSAKSTHEFLRM